MRLGIRALAAACPVVAAGWNSPRAGNRGSAAPAKPAPVRDLAGIWLELDVTIEDPKALAKPWISSSGDYVGVGPEPLDV